MAPKEPARNHVEEDDDSLSRANREILRLKAALGDKQLGLLSNRIERGKAKRVLQQKVRRANVKLDRKPSAQTASEVTGDDVQLLLA